MCKLESNKMSLLGVCMGRPEVGNTGTLYSQSESVHDHQGPRGTHQSCARVSCLHDKMNKNYSHRKLV